MVRAGCMAKALAVLGSDKCPPETRAAAAVLVEAMLPEGAAYDCSTIDKTSI